MQQQPAWKALKRALRSNVIAIENLSEVQDRSETLTIAPAPIPLDVKIEVALALGCAFISAIASSSVFTGQIDATGPKISSRPMVILADTSSNTVGPTVS